MADEAKLCSPLCSPFGVLVVRLRLGIVMEKNWVLSIDQCQLQALQFLMHLIDLLSILLRCNGFAGIQKAVVDQMSSRPPNSDHDPHLGASLAHQLSYTIHFSLHVKIQLRSGALLLHRVREDDAFQNDDVFDLQSAYDAPTY